MVHVTQAETQAETHSGEIRFDHLCRPPQRLYAAEPGLGVRSHEPKTCEDRIRAPGGVETLAALTVAATL